nr:T9SS type A sorting domain-containing protein [Bacteroidota bacterium]
YFEPAIAGEGDHLITYVYTNSSGCSDTAALSINVDKCLGIADINETQLLVYYNSLNQGISIVTDSKEAFSLNILSLTGQLVYAAELKGKEQYFISTESFNSGIYLLRLMGEKGIFSKKVMVAR